MGLPVLALSYFQVSGLVLNVFRDFCRYPGGYALLFVPSYMPDYTGHHWAVYDNNDNFCGYDDSDATSGELLQSS